MPLSDYHEAIETSLSLQTDEPAWKCIMQDFTCNNVFAHESVAHAVRRRTFLVAGALGFCGLNAAQLAASGPDRSPGTNQPAKTAILIWLEGGASHIDTWDMKPQAPREYRGPFEPIATSAPGIELCEHLPQLAQQAHHLAIVRSLGHFRRGTGDHHAGYYYNLTGHAPDPSFPRLLNSRTPRSDDWPFWGTVIGYKRPPHPYLPQVVTLPYKVGAPMYTRPGQFAAKLGVQHDPLYVDGNVDKPTEFTAPALSLEGDISVPRLRSRRALLDNIDQARRAFDESTQTTTYGTQQSRAFSLLGSEGVRNTFDLSKEKDRTLDRYGRTMNGMSMLMARRLAEEGVPCVAVYWKGNSKLAKAKNCPNGGGWDTHGQNFRCLEQVLLPELDQCLSALLEDLDQRGLLDTTLIQVNSEMGRKTKIGDPRSGGVSGAGRDHWTHAMSVLFAGGGIRGGQAYGTTDAVAAYPADRPVAPEDITKTVYKSMGIDDLHANDALGRPFRLLEAGNPIVDLFA